MQVVLLGSGDPQLESAFSRLAAMFPTKMSATIGYNNQLAHLIEAGSDFFVMPSRFEPCGLNQMYSMAYGTPPIVRTTGGLVDTVAAWDPQVPGAGTGINFRDAVPDALRWALERALQLYYDYPQDYYAVRSNGMRRDFSWDRSVEKYEEVYRSAIEMRKGMFPPKPPAKKKAVAKKAEPAPEPAPTPAPAPAPLAAKAPEAPKAKAPAPAAAPVAAPAPAPAKKAPAKAAKAAPKAKKSAKKK
jgi:starch synthase